jgi:putative membrane protein
MVFSAFQGFCMALADSVPGVSGGTIAFILGFYEEFLTALHNLFGHDRAERRNAVRFLAKIGVGWCLGMILSILVISRALDHGIYMMSSIFLGLTVAAIPFIVLTEKSVLRLSPTTLLLFLLGIGLVCLPTAIRGTFPQNGNLHLLDLTIGQGVQLFLSGALAISAMALPGISGSTLLLILGAYAPIVHALEQLFRLNFSYLPGILIFIAGIFCGIALSVRYIRMFLRRHRSGMMSLILGLMVGSLYAIVMGPTTLEIPQEPLSIERFHWEGFLIGIAILFGLETTRRFMAARQ